MKKLEIKTNKRLLIVEYETDQQASEVLKLHEPENELINIIIKDKVNALCKGSELTEELAEEFSKPVKSSHGEDGFINYLYESKEIVYSPAFVTALESFISAIEASGYHWGENPVKEPRMSDYGWYASGHPEEDSGWMYEDGEDKYYESLKLFEESESRTFNPSKCIIFEIV